MTGHPSPRAVRRTPETDRAAGLPPGSAPTEETDMAIATFRPVDGRDVRLSADPAGRPFRLCRVQP